MVPVALVPDSVLGESVENGLAVVKEETTAVEMPVPAITGLPKPTPDSSIHNLANVLNEQVAAIGLESLLHEGVAVLNVLRQSGHLH